MSFNLTSAYKPSGDQPDAIRQLVDSIRQGEKEQVLLGVTGSGKTFTMANVIQEVDKPTLILSHNKTLVAQLYGEFKQFFPENAVEYFVSYYDYYQPEAFMPVSGVYIEKDLSINEEIEKLRLKATSSLLSGRRDVIILASVSCIYGMGNPTEFKNGIVRIQKGETIARNRLLHRLVDSLYSRAGDDFKRGTFRVKGDTVDINLPYADYWYRIVFFGDDIEEIVSYENGSNLKIGELENAAIFPANLYLAPKDQFNTIMREVEDDMFAQTAYFESTGKMEEAKRLRERTNFDLEMMRELGYCSGIENYSRYFDRRHQGERPFCLLDYFPDDYLMFVDESHVTLPQIRGMYGGDRARKHNLVDYGFRLPAAMDNRPLMFNEFEQLINQVVYVSATPSDYELDHTDGVYVEQVVRPTGLLDPVIEVRPSLRQVDDLLDEIDIRSKINERVLVTTLTKRMSEELAKYFTKLNIKSRYIHSEVDSMERVEILRDLRLGKFDVLIGVNLLREGLDLPEVSLVAILDADKEGFLRNDTSLTQISGRAARNSNGKVIMYADTITKSMQHTIDETNRRREKQIAFNTEHGLTPQTVLKTRSEIMKQGAVLDFKNKKESTYYVEPDELSLVADPIVEYMGKPELEKAIDQARKQMDKAAKDLDFIEAARLRDDMFALQKMLQEKFAKES